MRRSNRMKVVYQEYTICEAYPAPSPSFDHSRSPFVNGVFQYAIKQKRWKAVSRLSLVSILNSSEKSPMNIFC